MRKTWRSEHERERERIKGESTQRGQSYFTHYIPQSDVPTGVGTGMHLTN